MHVGHTIGGHVGLEQVHGIFEIDQPALRGSATTLAAVEVSSPLVDQRLNVRRNLRQSHNSLRPHDVLVVNPSQAATDMADRELGDGFVDAKA